MFKFLKRKIDITVGELTDAVKDFTVAADELKRLSLPRKLDEISCRIKNVDSGIDRIYYLLQKYIDSKEISDINRLTIENKTLRDCISMVKEQQEGKKSKTAEKRSEQP